MDAFSKPKQPTARYRTQLGIPSVIWVIAGAAFIQPVPTSALSRCEGRDGHVTYTDEACPPNTRHVRRIDATPAVVTQDSRSARTAEGAAARDETRATAAAARHGKEERDEARAADKETPTDRTGKDASHERPTVASAPSRVESGGRIQSAAPAAPANPEQEIQRLDEQRLRQERQCADLNRRIEFARADLAIAGGSERASIELSLRRLEEDARNICP